MTREIQENLTQWADTGFCKGLHGVAGGEGGLDGGLRNPEKSKKNYMAWLVEREDLRRKESLARKTSCLQSKGIIQRKK